MHYMEIGGAEISLIGLLQAFDYSKYDVDLFIYSHQGELMQFIPKEVNILPEIKEYSVVEKPILHVLKECCLRIIYARLRAKWLYKRYLKKNGISNSVAIFQYIGDAVTCVLPSLESLGEYDLAISYLNPHNIVRDKVKAKKKICWIHTDYSRIDVNVEQELPVWDSYNHIVSISLDVTKTFLQVFPSLKDKILEMENILSPTFVRERAGLISQSEIEKEIPREDNTLNILSVGRFCEAKNYDNVPDICRKINSQLSALGSQLSVKWYLIGYGEEELIRQKIAEAGMDEHVIILGKKSNPYPYIKVCDIYCQPSRYEGKSVTVREAQMLCKPVVVTNYPTAKSQIQDGVDGVITPLNNEDCSKGIVKFILNETIQDQIVYYLKQHDYGNVNEVQKIYKLIEE